MTTHGEVPPIRTKTFYLLFYSGLTVGVLKQVSPSIGFSQAIFLQSKKKIGIRMGGK
jgi:hypothetical protein